jgi:ornithine carbamoyltransferase
MTANDTAIEPRELEPRPVARRHLLDLTDISTAELGQILRCARNLQTSSQRTDQRLKGKTVAQIFEQPSLRTRVSFEVAILEMGGHALYLHPAEVGLGRREPVVDVARVLSGYVDAVVLRLSSHEVLEQFAAAASVPTINGMSDRSHPCQGITDVFTIRQLKGPHARIAYVGDGNAVAHALLLAAAHCGFTISLACPRGYEVAEPTIAAARSLAISAGGSIVTLEDPREAVRDADVIYTASWRPVGHELERERREREFQRYRVDRALLGLARPDAVVMHDLPARRGEEISAEVLDGARSIVYQQARNRLPVQKALLLWLLRPGSGRTLA